MVGAHLSSSLHSQATATDSPAEGTQHMCVLLPICACVLCVGVAWAEFHDPQSVVHMYVHNVVCSEESL